jgi:ankyrin repeat protein
MKENDRVKIVKEKMLIEACEHGLIKVVEALIKSEVDVTINDNFAIRWASYNGQDTIVQLLIDVGADCTTCNNEAIRWASKNGHLKVVDILIANGADVTADCNEAIRKASMNGHLEIVRSLIKAGAGVEDLNKFAINITGAKINNYTTINNLLKAQL